MSVRKGLQNPDSCWFEIDSLNHKRCYTHLATDLSGGIRTRDTRCLEYVPFTHPSCELKVRIYIEARTTYHKEHPLAPQGRLMKYDKCSTPSYDLFTTPIPLYSTLLPLFKKSLGVMTT